VAIGVMVAVAAAWQFGIAGFRYGGVAVPAVLAVVVGAATWFVLAARTAGRGLWTVSAVVLGLVVGAVLVDAAPPSRGALRADLDEVRLDFYEVLSEQAAGHSTCRPSCPSVTRVYRAPYTSDRANSATVFASLRGAGLVQPPPRFVMPTTLSLRQPIEGRRVLEVRTFRVDDAPEGRSPFRVRIRLRATR
jgi:hypothetical protein